MNQPAAGQINMVVVREEGARRSWGPKPSERRSEEPTERGSAAFQRGAALIFSDTPSPLNFPKITVEFSLMLFYHLLLQWR